MMPNSCGRCLLFYVLMLGSLSVAYGSPALAAAGEALSKPPVASPANPGLVRLTLAEAQELALRNNKSLALALLNVEEKGHATAAARKDYFPKVIGSDT